MTVRLDKAVKVIPLGIAMGLIVILMNVAHSVWLAVPLIILIGGLAGFFRRTLAHVGRAGGAFLDGGVGGFAGLFVCALAASSHAQQRGGGHAHQH